MKKLYMIHGWGGSSEDNWFPWLKSELEKKKNNIEIYVFDMPDSETPRIEKWVGYLEEEIKEVDEHTYFIGHSIGCQTIMRFLEKLHKHKKIGGCIFIAGWFNLTKETYEDEGDKKLMHPWTTRQIDFSRVLDHCDNFLAIFSKNDPYVHISDSKIFEEKLNAKVIIEKNKGHFEDEVQPLILKEALKFIK